MFLLLTLNKYMLVGLYLKEIIAEFFKNISLSTAHGQYARVSF